MAWGAAQTTETRGLLIWRPVQDAAAAGLVPLAAEAGICSGPSPWCVDSFSSPCPQAAFPLCCLCPGFPFLEVSLD